MTIDFRIARRRTLGGLIGGAALVGSGLVFAPAAQADYGACPGEFFCLYTNVSGGGSQYQCHDANQVMGPVYARSAVNMGSSGMKACAYSETSYGGTLQVSDPQYVSKSFTQRVVRSNKWVDPSVNC